MIHIVKVSFGQLPKCVYFSERFVVGDHLEKLEEAGNLNVEG